MPGKTEKLLPKSPETNPYPLISDYGFIGDCHASALISREGSVDWCCLPRIDSASCFGRLLGWETGGYFRITPVDPFQSSRCYLKNTLILETRFQTATGKMRLVDLFPIKGSHPEDKPRHQLLRIIESIEGEIKLTIEILPRFDYGAIQPWIRRYGDNSFMAIGGSAGLLISGDILFEQPDRHSLTAQITLSGSEKKRISIIHHVPKALDYGLIKPPDSAELDQRLEETISWWDNWTTNGKATGPLAEMLHRSAIVLKGLSNAATGAIAAAATTSLPEAPGGARNWDYRFTWIRDSVFTIRSLAEIGYLTEADDFRRFVERSAAGSAADLQIMYGVGGERRLAEYEVDTLSGYDGAKPVRIGNAACKQVQLDIYGELMDLAWRWHQGGSSPDDDYWEFLVEVVAQVGRNWNKKDHGIWEVRKFSRHFVFSKVMCWSAVDKGIALAEELGRAAPLDKWRDLRNRIRRAIEEKGYDHQRGIFVQHFGGKRMDAALLRMPMTGFIAYDDPRMVRTVDAIMAELSQGGLVKRYAHGSDGFKEQEGTFIACTFWLVEVLCRQGRADKAHEFFKQALATANDLGLFSEQYDVRSQRMLGNFPQALTHLSFISAAICLGKV